jgi:hypothetical protein
MIRIDLTSDVPIQFKCKTSDTFVFDGLDFFSDTAKTIPLDISADTFRMLVLDPDGETVLTFSSGNFTVSGTDDNHLKISATAATMTVDPTPANQPHSFFLEWTKASDSKVTTIATGQFVIEEKDKNA